LLDGNEFICSEKVLLQGVNSIFEVAVDVIESALFCIESEELLFCIFAVQHSKLNLKKLYFLVNISKLIEGVLFLI
jgi:hypothetical protein